MRYPHLAARLYNSPLLVDPAKAAVIEQVFRAHLFGEAKPAANPEDFARPEAGVSTLRFQERAGRPYSITEGGVAVIPVVGTLVQRADSLDAMSGLIGYNRLERQLSAAFDDPAARAIVLEVDSPGGEANGCFDLAEKIMSARGEKPVWSHANEQAFSAAYALGCAASRFVVAPTGLVGSIGVIALHVDQSKRDAQMGYVYTPITFGDRKNDFSSHEALSEPARGILQAEVDRLGEIFVAHVAKAMGIDAKAVRATQAGLLNPETALRGGFVHAIASFTDTVTELEDKVKASWSSRTVFARKAQAAVPEAPNPSADAAHQPQEAAMEKDKPAATQDKPAEQPKPQQEAAQPDTAKVAADARKAERDRMNGILGCEEAKGRGKLAQHFAMETDMSVDAAKKALAASPVETGSSGGQFGAAMGGLANPKVGADTETDLGSGKPSIDTTAIYDARRPQPLQ